MHKTSKKLINGLDKCVDDSLEGYVAVNPGVRILRGHRVVLRADIDEVKHSGKVTLVSGGGSGHEPTHAGYVGPGMLSAAVAGAVFTSPPPDSILAAIRAVGRNNPGGCLVLANNYTGDRLTFGLAVERAGNEGIKVDQVFWGDDCALMSVDKSAGRRGLAGCIFLMKQYLFNARARACFTYDRSPFAGTLLIVKNYTGDRINFGLAAERAKNEGLKVDTIIIGEDCALATHDKTAGRRGLCGTLLFHKVAGALSDEGKSLEEIVQICKSMMNRVGTIGLCLSPCSIPGSGPSFHINDDEMELGLGAHGEAGVKTLKLASSREAVRIMINHMTSVENASRLDVNSGDQVACMINNMGGMSMLELNIVAKEAIHYLEENGVIVERAYCGTLLTSMEMAGVSITVMLLDDTLKRCLDASTKVHNWPQPLLPNDATVRHTPQPMDVAGVDTDAGEQEAARMTGFVISSESSDKLYLVLRHVCERLISSENILNALDTESGDGDCGSTMARGAKAVLVSLGTQQDPGLSVNCPCSLLKSLAAIAEHHMGGSSGGLYSLFLTSAASHFQSDVGIQAWSKALSAGILTIMKYGGAEPGDRTMLDSLVPACKSLSDIAGTSSMLDCLKLTVEVAETSAADTVKMKARAGRASYVSADRLSKPDPGATAVAIWMRAAYEKLQQLME